MSTQVEEKVWRVKVASLAQRYQRRVRELARWVESLSRERAALTRENRRLAAKARRLQRERDAAQRQISCFECEALSRFLGSALEIAPGVETPRTFPSTRDRERRIMALLRSEVGSKTG